MIQVKYLDPRTGAVFNIGDQPGAGIYRCLEHPGFVVHIEEGDTLPPCEGHESRDDVTYRRVVDERDAVTPDDFETNE